jgi:hypothetical protein
MCHGSPLSKCHSCVSISHSDERRPYPLALPLVHRSVRSRIRGLSMIRCCFKNGTFRPNKRLGWHDDARISGRAPAQTTLPRHDPHNAAANRTIPGSWVFYREQGKKRPPGRSAKSHKRPSKPNSRHPSPMQSHTNAHNQTMI